MTKETITIASLQNLLDYFFKTRNAEQKNRKSNSWILDKAGNATFILNENISITISTYLNPSNVMESDGESIHIKGLSILGEKYKDTLDVDGHIKYIDKLIFEEVDFGYKEDTGGIIPSMPIMISTHNCTVVKLINCTTKNNTPLSVRYNMPKEIPLAGYPKKNELIIKNCKFKHLDIITISLEKIGGPMGIISKGKLKSSDGTPTINLHMDFNGSFLQRLILDLYKSPSDEYKYSYSAKLINENDIEEFIIKDEYPDVLAWGTREKIGDRISKNYKGQDKKHGTKRISADVAWKILNNNKIAFMRFKKLAADKGDELQENTINYHIAKCDEHLISLDGPSTRLTQTKLIMALRRKLLYDKSFWALLLIYIIIFNLAASAIIFAIIDSMNLLSIDKLDLSYIFWELINPSSSGLSIIQGINENFDYRDLGVAYRWISAIVLLSKGFAMICGFMLLWIFKSWLPTK